MSQIQNSINRGQGSWVEVTIQKPDSRLSERDWQLMATIMQTINEFDAYEPAGFRSAKEEQ